LLACAMVRRLWAFTTIVVLATAQAMAQTPVPEDSSPQPAAQKVEERPCPGCPPRRLGKAFLQVTIVNGFYELANLVRGQATAHITPESFGGAFVIR